jgi:hypothetical protein
LKHPNSQGKKGVSDFYAKRQFVRANEIKIAFSLEII